jgi:DNA-binding MarR family transcriptional regulator
MPDEQTSLQRVERALEQAARRENRLQVYRSLAERAGLELEPQFCWLLYRLADRPDSTAASIAARAKVDPERLAKGVAALERLGLVTVDDGAGEGQLRLSRAGEETVERLTVARRVGLLELLEGWDPEAHPELIELVRRLARALLVDDEKLLAESRPRVAPDPLA